MSQPQERPKLKLSFSRPPSISQPSPATASSPLPPQPPVIPPQRAPSLNLKLSFSRPSLPTIETPSAKKKPKTPAANAVNPAKKRKRAKEDDGVQNESSKRPQPGRKLTLSLSVPAPALNHGVPTIKLKHKGKIPKRPAGVGYDSELDERESDPVQIDGFILRMQPGPDCDYVHEAIANGKIGERRSDGGADIQMKMFDTAGRRGLLTVRQHKYAMSMVDLPCIIEGMKSWDKKGVDQECGHLPDATRIGPPAPQKKKPSIILFPLKSIRRHINTRMESLRQ